jgi:hypothetical protein
MNEAGRLVADALRGAWRISPPPLEMSPTQFDAVESQLVASGCGALIWRKISASNTIVPAGATFHDIYRSSALSAARQRRTIEVIMEQFAQLKIRSILMKGWALARLYPEIGMRATGDIDLCIAPEDRERAGEILNDAGLIDSVDSDHLEFTLSGDSYEDVFERSVIHELDGVPVRVLCPEDSLRLVCIHFLQHGGWRPLWLCDVAVSIENRPADFDWARCVGDDPVRSDWVVSVLALAGVLLDATIDNTPAAEKRGRLPAWFVASVLEKWGTLSIEQARNGYFPAVRTLLRPILLTRALNHRWRDSIRATVMAGGRFDESARLPLKIKWALKRARGAFLSDNHALKTGDRS